MKIYNNFLEYKKVSNAIVTIGTFDGVHLGHKAMIAELREAADVARFDVGLELQDHVGGSAIELRCLDLDVGVFFVPPVDDLVDRGHSFAIGQAVKVLDLDGPVRAG